MGANTRIEWAHHTFNPWYGCQKVGPGCDYCYAEGWAKRSGLVQWGPGAERRRSSAANWRKPLAWNAEAGRLGVRYRVFCASLADVFDNAVPIPWRMDLFSLIAQTPHLDWLIVTKRVGNVMKMCTGDGLMFDMIAARVWLGITVCNQEEADRDIPKLLEIPAKVRWLSCEPLLGPVDIERHLLSTYDKAAHDVQMRAGLPQDDKLDWVVVGGESGPHARPMHPDWARSLRDQCATWGTPFLFKQWGEWAPAESTPDDDRSYPERWIAHDGRLIEPGDGVDFFKGDEVLYRVAKKASGRMLDDALHDGYPEAP